MLYKVALKSGRHINSGDQTHNSWGRLSNQFCEGPLSLFTSLIWRPRLGLPTCPIMTSKLSTGVWTGGIKVSLGCEY